MTVTTRCRSLLLGLISLSLSTAVYASPGLDALAQFFKHTLTFEAQFEQVVLDESLITLDEGRGQVWIKRPNLFRWDYAPPEAQIIVGDGERVWLYDRDLEQVTVRDQQQALGQTPAMLLAGGGDLQDNYELIDIGTQGRFDWVNLVAKATDSSFTEIRIGFEHNQLRLMELLDRLGQRTRISFSAVRENLPSAPQRFTFTPPDGIDVIDETQP